MNLRSFLFAVWFYLWMLVYGLLGMVTFLVSPRAVVKGLRIWSHGVLFGLRVIGGVRVGKVQPGDSISANAGFGFAANPRLSFSLGYKHTYIFPTKTDLGGVRQQSTSLQAGQFNVGFSYALTDRLVITNTYSIGTTRDAPDMEVMFRLPIRF